MDIALSIDPNKIKSSKLYQQFISTLNSDDQEQTQPPKHLLSTQLLQHSSIVQKQKPQIKEKKVRPQRSFANERNNKVDSKPMLQNHRITTTQSQNFEFMPFNEPSKKQQQNQLQQHLRLSRKQSVTITTEPQPSLYSRQFQLEQKLSEKKIIELQKQISHLVAQNQNLKIKVLNQNKNMHKLQEEAKELAIKNDQLTQQLNKREILGNKKVQQTAYWKSQTESLRNQLLHCRLQFQRQKQMALETSQKTQHILSQLKLKEQLLIDMRGKNQQILKQNARIREESIKIQLQLRESQILNHNLRQELKNLQCERVSLGKINYQETINLVQPRRQRGQFQRQKPRFQGTTAQKGRIQKFQINQRPKDKIDRKQAEQLLNKLKAAEPAPAQKLQQFKQPTKKHNFVRRGQLQEELAKLKDSRAKTGAMRRRMCQIERELEQMQQEH